MLNNLLLTKGVYMDGAKQLRTAGEIQSQLNRLNELLDVLDKELQMAREAYATVIVNYDVPLMSAAGADAPAPEVKQSPMAHLLDAVNKRLQSSISELADMRSKCQL
jgi:hypothetical protein